MVDANCAYDVSKAKRILFDTADADLYWFEEPISPENRTGYAELKTSPKHIWLPANRSIPSTTIRNGSKLGR